jgi:putative tryptophan/tyrosine transport system substrate-binding protein
MRRREFLVGGLLATSFTSQTAAQPKDRARQLLLIGHAWSDQPSAPTRWSVFLNELRHHGYADGANLFVTWHEGLENLSQTKNDWPKVMDDIRRLSPDAIVTSSHGWARMLSAAYSTIPIVVTALSPIEQDVVSSLARPSGNVTGVAIDFGPDFYSKQLDLLLEAAPKISHVAFAGAERAYFGMRQLWREAQQRGVGIQEFPYFDDYEAHFSSMIQEGAKAILLLANARHVRHTELIARLARQHRLPLMSPFRRLTEAGGLLSYGIDWIEIDRRLAAYTARVLGGTKPSELPFEQPSRFELVLNLQTADHLGLTFPGSLIAFADDILERDRIP